MLLPSALPCDFYSPVVQSQYQRSQRPKLPSFADYPPQRSSSPVVGLIASCRALQSILGERLLPSPSPSVELISTPLPRPSLGAPTPQSEPARISRGKNKRNRDEYESDAEEETPKQSKQHIDLYSTPKRIRRIPLDIPAGLDASDFEALNTPPSRIRGREIEITMPPQHTPAPSETPSPSSTQFIDMSWNERDDRLLVETVLSKLRLSKRDWNDCARQLGKDMDSLDRRWNLLVGKGNIGLRRGAGPRERVNLDIPSW